MKRRTFASAAALTLAVPSLVLAVPSPLSPTPPPADPQPIKTVAELTAWMEETFKCSWGDGVTEVRDVGDAVPFGYYTMEAPDAEERLVQLLQGEVLDLLKEDYAFGDTLVWLEQPYTRKFVTQEYTWVELRMRCAITPEHIRQRNLRTALCAVGQREASWARA